MPYKAFASKNGKVITARLIVRWVRDLNPGLPGSRAACCAQQARRPVRERGREPARSPLNPATRRYRTPTASRVRQCLILISQAV